MVAKECLKLCLKHPVAVEPDLRQLIFTKREGFKLRVTISDEVNKSDVALFARRSLLCGAYHIYYDPFNAVKEEVSVSLGLACGVFDHSNRAVEMSELIKCAVRSY